MLYDRKPMRDVLAATPELRLNGDWLCLNITTGTPWPTEPQPMSFEGHVLWVMPHTTDHHAGLALNRPDDLDRDDAWAVLHRALSLLAWREDAGALVAHMSGGNIPRMMSLDHERGVTLRAAFDLSDLPRIDNPRASLALALMREARGLNHAAYSFLSFFRVIEVAIPNGKDRGRWIQDSIDQLDGRAQDALVKLREIVPGDIGVHLRESGRHAIAHAARGTIIDPDEPRDARRLRAELPIMRGLAELAIEKRLGIQTSSTIWREHLHELKGWKRLLGQELVSSVLAGQLPAQDNLDLPMLNVRLRRSEPFRPFERMTPIHAASLGHALELTYRSEDGRVDLTFRLLFAQERLLFDPDRSVTGQDDGTVDAGRNARDLTRFGRDYFGNGELQMWNADTGELISRCDAFIPVNCHVDHDASEAAMAEWDAEIARREACSL